MREARFHSFHSTFGKMTAFYICFGMIPLVLISLIFFFWYYLDVMQSAKSNCGLCGTEHFRPAGDGG